MAVMTAEAIPTLGQHLIALRGKERPTDVARRIRFEITAHHITNLENDGVTDIKPRTLMLLAEAYEEHYPSREAAFWDLWKRAGYPLPPGYVETDRATEESIRRIMGILARMRPEDQRRWVDEFEAKTSVDERTLRQRDVRLPLPKVGPS